MWERLLDYGIQLTIVSMVGLLLIAFVTGFDGYSYTHCQNFSFAHTVHAHGEEDISPDQQRINDLYALRTQLRAHYESHGVYPILAEGGSIGNVHELTSVPNDPCQDENNTYTYLYRSNVEGSTYVLRTLLSDTGYRYIHAQYPEKLSGTHLGWWCGDDKHRRAFCLGPE